MEQGDMGQEQDHKAAASDEALAWVARLRADTLTDADIDAFALWLGSNPHHRAELDAALALWHDLAVVRHLPIDASGEESREQPSHGRPMETSDLPVREAANGALWKSVAAVAASVCLAVLLWPLTDQPTTPQYFQTAHGERRAVTLDDESRLTINTDSRIKVRYERDQRTLSLLRGEVYFEVAPDPERPFHVDTNGVRVTAIGTAFNIRREGDRSEITVTEGVVRVVETGATGNRAPATEVLRANEGLLASRAGFEDTGGVDTDSLLAWQRGELVVTKMRLPVLAEELERYYDISILIADADVAAMTVSGVFLLDQPHEDLLRALELSLDLEARQLDDNTVQLLKRAR